MGFQCDEVSDASNWEQLGLIIRYVTNDKPTERLLEFLVLKRLLAKPYAIQLLIS